MREERTGFIGIAEKAAETEDFGGELAGRMIEAIDGWASDVARSALGVRTDNPGGNLVALREFGVLKGAESDAMRRTRYECLRTMGGGGDSIREDRMAVVEAMRRVEALGTVD